MNAMAAIFNEIQRPLTSQSSHQGQVNKLSSLQPLKRKLDRIETERIYRTIQSSLQSLRQVEILVWLTEDDANLFRVTDEQLRSLILNHQYIIRSEDIDHVKFQNSLKNILRYCTFKNIKLSIFKPPCIKTEQSGGIWNIVEYFEEMREVMLERLLTEREEENARWKYLLLTMEKSRQAQNVIVNLKKTLKEKVLDKNGEIDEKEREVIELKKSLDLMKTTCEEQNNTTLNDAAKQILSNQMSMENKKQKCKVESMSLKDKVRKSTIQNYDQESKLRKRKFKLAGELYNWILKYDQDMGWRQDQINELKELNERDLSDIEQLENHFIELQKEYDAIMEERRIIAEEKKRKETEERERKEASIKIQAIWRGYETRKMLSQPGGKKGKKGAGKKGGGGKKGKKQKK